MGYTHYWTTRRAITDDEWRRFVAGAAKLGVAAKGDREILIDGQCETFIVNRDTVGFDFCKTRSTTGYDREVTACLILLKDVMGDDVKVSSDGGWEEWIRGRALYSEAFGVIPGCPWGPEDVEE